MNAYREAAHCHARPISAIYTAAQRRPHMRPSPRLLASFAITRHVRDDRWNNQPNSDVYCQIINEHGHCVGDFNYLTAVGQIGDIFLVNSLRNCMLEQQILLYMMRDMQQAGATHIWEARPQFLWHESKPFYSLLWDFKYASEWIHPSMNTQGYVMEIPENIDLLPLFSMDYHV